MVGDPPEDPQWVVLPQDDLFKLSEDSLGFESPNWEGFLKLGSRVSSKERSSGTSSRPPVRFSVVEKQQVPHGRGVRTKRKMGGP